MRDHNNFKHKLINLSSYIFFKPANLTTKNYSKSSWVLPINKYDVVKFFSSLIFYQMRVFFINIRVKICFTRSVIYLADVTVSTKELFQIILTLISNSSHCENMIALFVFSFILLFLLLPHKKDLRLKACISTIFLFFSIFHFSSKKFLSSFPENTLKNITTPEFFSYESIKASNLASMVCFN